MNKKEKKINILKNLDFYDVILIQLLNDFKCSLQDKYTSMKTNSKYNKVIKAKHLI